MYFDEDLVLDIRLNTLVDKVDKFIIAEATKNHAGESKKLNFIAFNEMNPDVKNSFKNHFPNENDEVNLELWDKFEKIYPKTFIGMYKFWIKK